MKKLIEKRLQQYIVLKEQYPSQNDTPEQEIQQKELPDVENLIEKIKTNSSVMALFKKINTKQEKVQAGVELIKNITNNDPYITKKISVELRALTNEQFDPEVGEDEYEFVEENSMLFQLEQMLKELVGRGYKKEVADIFKRVISRN